MVHIYMSESLHIINLHKGSNGKHSLQYKFLPNPKKCFRLLIFSPTNT